MVILFVEGTKDTSNGDLRKGFNKLLSKKLSGKMPRIVMGDGKKQAIDKFQNSNNSLLLCDLDGPEEKRERDISEHSLYESQHRVYYMIQEMEAWFISQPDILDKFYSTDLTRKIPRKPQLLLKIPMKNYKTGQEKPVKVNTIKSDTEQFSLRCLMPID